MTWRVEFCISFAIEDSISHHALISLGWEILYTCNSGTNKEASSNIRGGKNESTIEWVFIYWNLLLQIVSKLILYLYVIFLLRKTLLFLVTEFLTYL